MTEQENDLEIRWQRLKTRLENSDEVDNPLLHLARAVAGVKDSTMSCEECELWLPSYVDEEVAGMKVADEYPEVKRHLDLCDSCAATYVEMLELALAEEAGEVIVPDSIPSPDLGFLPSVPFLTLVQETVSQVAEKILSRLAPARLSELAIMSETFFDRLNELGGRFALTPQTAPAMGFGGGETSVSLRTLAATYETTRQVVEAYTPQEIQAYINQGAWVGILSQTAEKVGRDMMGRKEAQSFAPYYIAEMQDQTSDWLSLSASFHQDD